MQDAFYQQAEKTSWDSLSFFVLLRMTWIPMLLFSFILIGLAWWYSSTETIAQNVYSALIFVVYVIAFVPYALTLLRKATLTRNHITVIMGFLGFGVGLIVAVGKLLILFRGWAFLRLLSEPILTAILAGIIGMLVFWRRVQLNYKR